MGLGESVGWGAGIAAALALALIGGWSQSHNCCLLPTASVPAVAYLPVLALASALGLEHMVIPALARPCSPSLSPCMFSVPQAGAGAIE